MLGADRNYLYPALVTLANLARAGTPTDAATRGVLAVPKGTLSSGDLASVSALAGQLGFSRGIRIMEVNVDEFPEVHGYLSKAALIRLNLSDLLDGEPWFWLDVDANLGVEWIEVKGNFFPNPRKGRLVAAEALETDQVRRKVSGNLDYFNSGVISFHPSTSIDSSSLFHLYLGALLHFRDNGVIPDDQDAMNFVHKHDVHLIDSSFNVYGAALYDSLVSQPPKIAHFAGNTKPWHIHRRARLNCATNARCPWNGYFRDEISLHRAAKHLSKKTRRWLVTLAKQAEKGGVPDRKIVWFSRVGWLIPKYVLGVKGVRSFALGNKAHPLHTPYSLSL